VVQVLTPVPLPRELNAQHAALARFHPAVATWFARRFPDGPTEPQAQGWALIARGLDTLIAAPTGSGKTLAGFLVAIDSLYRAHAAGQHVSCATRVVYVSPLKALAVDIAQNLERPLAEIASVAVELGLEPAPVTVAVRTGDTSASERARMLRRRPSLVVTTPESLYLLLTSARGREALGTVETVIVDEIHAVARDKRGAHLALSLERLEALCDRHPVRIGLSATQRPIEVVGRLLVGDRPPPAVVDVGHRRDLDVALELPEGELEALASAEQLGDVLDRIAALVRLHRTTLVFVNTRSLAERLAHQLGEHLGDDVVAAHHGSLSRERRQRVETRLRAGDLKALVTTASLELGIDIGPVELVCQIGSPRSIATFLQRVGRSNHSRSGTPKGRLFPLTRDELVECTALLAAVRGGRLDAVEPARLPLDIMAQQMVAEVAAQEWSTAELYRVVRRAAPYAQLSRTQFDAVLDLVSRGIETGRGRRGAYLHHDAVNGELRARKGARLAAATSGGAIPEIGDYRVLAEPDDVLIGSVNEDWAVESNAGDIFLLGTHSWQIRRIESGVVRVRDAGDTPPTVPFWRGEAPARTAELSAEVSRLRSRVDDHLVGEDPDGARQMLIDAAGIDADAATMIVDYLATGRAVLGVMPSQLDLVLERFFDDTGGMQLVLHSPFGARINRGLGLALRKKFCRTFNFELQAAATDDAIVLSLGLTHSFPLEVVPRYLSSRTVADTLEHAILDSPMFQARWRWNLNRSLMVLRFRNGRRNPPPIQRMESDDLLAAVSPRQPPARTTSSARSRSRIMCSFARPLTTRSTKRSTSTACAPCSSASRPARCASTAATRPNRRSWRTRSSPPGRTPFWTTKRPRIVERMPCTSAAVCCGPLTWGRLARWIRRPSTECMPKSRHCRKRPTTCTTCCPRRFCSAHMLTGHASGWSWWSAAAAGSWSMTGSSSGRQLKPLRTQATLWLAATPPSCASCAATWSCRA
jgi:ATP-dependent Lhr-like helicase